MWKEFDPNFDISSLKIHDKYGEVDINIYNERLNKEELTELEKMIFPFSPDGTKYIDTYNFIYKLSLNEETGKVEIASRGGSPDSIVDLVNLKTNTRKTILSCGTPCGYYKAIWLNNSNFIVTASGEDTDMNKTPEIYLFNLDTNKVKWFIGKGVDYKKFWENYSIEELLN